MNRSMSRNNVPDISDSIYPLRPKDKYRFSHKIYRCGRETDDCENNSNTVFAEL